MTKKKSPQQQDAGPAAILDLAERNLARVLAALDGVIDDIEARIDTAPAKARVAAADLRKAIQTVFEERQRLEKLDRTFGNAGGGDGLDLDAARAEIGCRLARLRERGGAGDVS